jgi:glycosyltransferase involved in cell wall biosynthesis
MPFILCVGRIEPRKGQLDVVGVARELGLGLVLVGARSRLSPGYVQKVLRAARSLREFTHVERASQEELVDWYMSASSHVLASWFETVGLVSLEAVACGCPAVSTERSYIQEYLGESCIYVRPGDGASLVKGVESALARGRQSDTNTARARRFTWESAVSELLPTYDAVLAGSVASSGLEQS